jgi:hypothetical protein
MKIEEKLDTRQHSAHNVKMLGRWGWTVALTADRYAATDSDSRGDIREEFVDPGSRFNPGFLG